jgi:hypothetical protein
MGKEIDPDAWRAAKELAKGLKPGRYRMWWRDDFGDQRASLVILSMGESELEYRFAGMRDVECPVSAAICNGSTFERIEEETGDASSGVRRSDDCVSVGDDTLRDVGCAVVLVGCCFDDSIK